MRFFVTTLATFIKDIEANIKTILCSLFEHYKLSLLDEEALIDKFSRSFGLVIGKTANISSVLAKLAPKMISRLQLNLSLVHLSFYLSSFSISQEHNLILSI